MVGCRQLAGMESELSSCIRHEWIGLMERTKSHETIKLHIYPTNCHSAWPAICLPEMPPQSAATTRQDIAVHGTAVAPGGSFAIWIIDAKACARIDVGHILTVPSIIALRTTIAADTEVAGRERTAVSNLWPFCSRSGCLL